MRRSRGPVSTPIFSVNNLLCRLPNTHINTCTHSTHPWHLYIPRTLAKTRASRINSCEFNFNSAPAIASRSFCRPPSTFLLLLLHTHAHTRTQSAVPGTVTFALHAFRRSSVAPSASPASSPKLPLTDAFLFLLINYFCESSAWTYYFNFITLRAVSNIKS